MNRKRTLIYWIATAWLSLGMVSSGVVQLIQMPEERAMMEHLGYKAYVLPLLGIWKLLGVLAILLPRLPLLKEWAYAGFFFAMSGAVVSHAALGDAASEFIGPVLLLVLTLLSWYFRPDNRKVVVNSAAIV